MAGFRERWGIKHNYQLIMILLIFAINGSISARISGFLMDFLGINNENTPWVFYYLILILLVLPLYPFLLMGFGYLFGQSKFFFPFGKKLLKSIGLGFIFR
jgi:MFS-type transporter involved in bile tolerance (Atg22 family)